MPMQNSHCGPKVHKLVDNVDQSSMITAVRSELLVIVG